MDYLEALTVSFIAFPSRLSKTHLWFLIWFRRRLGWVAGIDSLEDGAAGLQAAGGEGTGGSVLWARRNQGGRWVKGFT